MARQLPKDATFLAARIRVTIDCPECAAPIPVNGLVTQVLCGACQSVVELRGQLGWERILTYQGGEGCPEHKVLVSSQKVKALDYFLAFGPRGGSLFRRWRNVLLEIDTAAARCPSCGHDLDVQRLGAEAVAEGAEVDVFCPGCGAAVPIRVPQREEREDTHAQCVALVGETALRGDLREPVGESVLFSCLGCGAPAKIDATVPRLMRCEFCDATSYLPDALWLRLHPAQRKRAWHALLISTPEIHAQAKSKV